MYQVDIVEAQEKLLELIEAAMRGEEVAIAKDNEPVVKLVVIPKKAKPNRQAGSAKGMVWMSDDFDEVAMRDEEVAITQDNQPVVKSVGIPPVNKKLWPSKAGSAKGMVWMSDDFDEPLEEFKEYME